MHEPLHHTGMCSALPEPNGARDHPSQPPPTAAAAPPPAAAAVLCEGLCELLDTAVPPPPPGYNSCSIGTARHGMAC